VLFLGRAITVLGISRIKAQEKSVSEKKLEPVDCVWMTPPRLDYACSRYLPSTSDVDGGFDRLHPPPRLRLCECKI
jgi:hypothetical protein